MLRKVFAVKDLAAETFGQPFFALSTGSVIRMFGDEVNKSGSELNGHPEHFVLFELGTFDDDTGMFATGVPRQLSLATDLLKAVRS